VGSLKLMHSLLDAGVVDEVRMLVCPASRGKGTRVFEDLARPEAGRGHLVRKRRGTSALRDQEISGKSALSKSRTPAMLLVWASAGVRSSATRLGSSAITDRLARKFVAHQRVAAQQEPQSRELVLPQAQPGVPSAPHSVAGSPPLTDDGHN
jgi:hypothetical protein